MAVSIPSAAAAPAEHLCRYSASPHAVSTASLRAFPYKAKQLFETLWVGRTYSGVEENKFS